MENLKAIFAENLIRLRTASGMTQLDLGEALSYTDKAVSKWERAESIPDVTTLLQIARLFHVTIDDLLKPEKEWTHPEPEPESPERQMARRKNAHLIVLLSLLGIATAAALVFVILWLAHAPDWRIFVYALPVVFITWLVLNSNLLEGRRNRFIVMGLVTSLLATVYVALIRLNPWPLLLLAIPLNLVVWISFHIKVRRK